MLDYKSATLILDDGSRFEGYSFGYDAPVAGEVVFNTAMTGYTESFTDPSYRGQILVMTYPLVGNYGVPSERAMRYIPWVLLSRTTQRSIATGMQSALSVNGYVERKSLG